MNSPCFDCPDRDFDCHGKCPKYKIYYEQNAAEREKNIKYRDRNQMLWDHLKKAQRNFKNKSGGISK